MQQSILFELLEIKALLNFCKLFTNASSEQGVSKYDKLLFCGSASFCLPWDKEKYK